MPTRIAPTLDVLQGNLTDLDPAKGVQAIERWETGLEDADWRGAKTIHADLGALRRQLESDAPDGEKIAELLTKLGESTARAAAHVEGKTGEQLQALAKALQGAGSGLGTA
ncbi:hypothetical protein K7W42_18295 [Deinococcus sp. HMF7604]|uniref:hypothetical protein n=1 Tax=Deinococcus betulae TaxID=2873312 RepID=UPI001CCEA2E4|nr:hypothetical protein [Deinococcus betulae]MBZ9752794.1 hypothetical protein [Deinococcus betulae]